MYEHLQIHAHRHTDTYLSFCRSVKTSDLLQLTNDAVSDVARASSEASTYDRSPNASRRDCRERDTRQM